MGIGHSDGGRFPGPTISSVVNKWGEQVDTDTADATVSAGQKLWPIKRTTQDYIFLDAAIQLSLKSTSGDDTILGSGAQKVKVIYQRSKKLPK